MKTPVFFLIFNLLFASPVFAKIRLVEWHTSSALAPIILPVREGETPEQASQRYINNLEKSPDLMELFEGKTPTFETVGYRELNDSQREQRALLVANLPKDTTKSSLRIEKLNLYLKQKEHLPFILPINSNLGLTIGETRELFDLISKKFPFMIGLGGDDIDPRLYDKENFHSRNVIPERDRFEISLIKSYVTSARGFYMGICRSSQLAAVALGYELIQDIPFNFPKNIGHDNSWHDVQLKPTTHSILKMSSSNGQTLNVYNYHHQAVIFKPGGFLELAAVSSDGITKATEFSDGRGILMQFHPELMDNNQGYRILSQIINVKTQTMTRSCSRIF
ncbi:gamma-glutamyl-gamma-aminobutyrate hydrolase family protein [Bdellovibrio sp. HCB337]|uniref:gamma-glutamyl-gamma-aminobutyrate hydrolase family protein n=1 Tax=Bdellovibrio sp. HCB337 TaxID=3394358 RepID=UPI0039A40897